MQNDKDFDCVQMKREIQEKLLEKWKGMTDEEIRQEFASWSSSSSDALARWWREIQSRQSATTNQSAPK